MKKSIFLTIATLFLAVCTTSIGYANTVQQTNTIQPDSTKFTIGIIYHDTTAWYVPEIKKLVEWTHWNVINANQKDLKSAKEVSEILENSNIVIIATHGGYDEHNGKHTLMLGDKDMPATYFKNDTIKVKKDAIIFAAACNTVRGKTLEEMNEFPSIFIGKGASIYFGFNTVVGDKLILDYCKHYLKALMYGKSIKEVAKEVIPHSIYNVATTGDTESNNREPIHLFRFPDNKDYRIPRWYFPGFIVGRELMTASINNNNHAFFSAIEQFKADLEFIKSLDSKLGEAYIEDLKNGVKSVFVDEAVKKGEKIENIDLDEKIEEFIAVIALVAEKKR